jgi:hypothetical protein
VKIGTKHGSVFLTVTKAFGSSAKSGMNCLASETFSDRVASFDHATEDFVCFCPRSEDPEKPELTLRRKRRGN